MRASVIFSSLVVGQAPVTVPGCLALLLEPLEPQFVFRPRALDEGHAKALAHSRQVEAVDVATSDGTVLRGWLKHPEHWTPGTRHGLVIVYGGVGQEVSEYVAPAPAPA